MRKLAIFLGIAGILGVIWVALTVFWEEPYTSWRHHAQVHELEAQLKVEERVSVAVTHKRTKSSPVLPRLPAGHAVGRLTGPHVNAILTYGRNNINAGPGLWHARPGLQQTVVVSGHRTTYGAPFRHIDEIHIGDLLTLKSPWGTWRYRVIRKAVVRPNDMWVTHNHGFEQLVLTACHPPYSAAYRYVVFAELVQSTS